MTRLLEPAAIPPNLWNPATGTLSLPESLSAAYVAAVDKNGLRDVATARSREDSPVGGLTKELTDRHFAQAFDGSAARALLAILDPKKEAGATSNTFIRCTAGTSISLTDAPCGAGAASLTFLATIAQLRREMVLPREPLHVKLIGAELSPHAREYAGNLFLEVQPFLESQAIFVEPEFQAWDVTCQLSNTDLVTRCVVASHGVSARLLVVANFNGFLERDGKRSEAEPQLAELFRYASSADSFAVWIEPNMNAATVRGGFFPWLASKAEAGWKKFARLIGKKSKDAPAYVSEARFQLPLDPMQTARVGLAVMPLELERGS